MSQIDLKKLGVPPTGGSESLVLPKAPSGGSNGAANVTAQLPDQSGAALFSQLPPPRQSTIDLQLPGRTGGSTQSTERLRTLTELRSVVAGGGRLSDADMMTLAISEGSRVAGPGSTLGPVELARLGVSHLASEFKQSGNMRGLRAMEASPVFNDTERAYVLQPGIDHRRIGIG